MNKRDEVNQIVKDNFPSSKEMFKEGYYSDLYKIIIKDADLINGLPDNIERICRLKDFFSSERSENGYVEDRGIRISLFIDDNFIYLKDHSYRYVHKNDNYETNEDNVRIYKKDIDKFLERFK